MKTFLALLLTVTIAFQATAERLPSLKPIGNPTTIAETILDLPDKAPIERFTQPEPESHSEPALTQDFTPTRAPVIAPRENFTMTPAPNRINITPTAPEPTQLSKAPQSIPAAPRESAPATVLTMPQPIVSLKEPAILTPPVVERRLNLTSDEMLAQMHFFANADLPQAAQTLANIFLTEFIAHPNKDEALYYTALYAPDKSTRGKALQELKVEHEFSAWTQAAAYKTLWQFAQNNRLNSTFQDTRAQALKQKVNALPYAVDKLQTARLINIIPGGGHILNENIIMGALYLLLTLALVWGITYALMWGQIPYVVIFVLMVLTINTHSFKTLKPLVENKISAERAAAFASWDDLQPRTPAEILRGQ